MSEPITAVVARRSRMQMTAETRSTLLRLARQMFGKTGYADASMDELTAAAGMTRGALYHHFGSKQGLFEAVVEQIDEEMDDQLKALATKEKDEWKALCVSARAYLEMVLEPTVQRIMLRDAPTTYPNFSARPKQLLCGSHMAESFRRLMDNRIIQSADPTAVASMLTGAISSLAIWAAGAKSDEASLRHAQEALDLLLTGLRSPTASRQAE